MTSWMDSSLSFGQRVAIALDEVGPLCVGIDPHASLLHEWGLNDDLEGLREFCARTLEAATGQAAFIKPQSAFFERHGSGGIAVLEDVIRVAKSHDMMTILDVKRGDIGSTMGGYADAYLGGRTALDVEAITVSPYLGPESLNVAVELAQRNNRGLFVLCLTSNPEGASVQHAIGSDNRPVAKAVVDYVDTFNDGPIGSFGLVVGATTKDSATTLGIDFTASTAPLLVPGIGAQGATPDDLPTIFGAASSRVIAPVSRGILRHGPVSHDMRQTISTLQADLRRALS